MNVPEVPVWVWVAASAASVATSMLTVFLATYSSRSSRIARARARAEVRQSLVRMVEAEESYKRELKAARGRAEEVSAATVDDRIDRLVRSLQDSQSIMNELQAEVSVRKAAVDRLRAEEEKSRQLAALREEEAKAVRDLVTTAIATAHQNLQGKLIEERTELQQRLATLQAELDRSGKKGRRDQVLLFVSGALLSVPIGFLVNHYS